MSVGQKKASFLKRAVRLKKELARGFRLRLIMSQYQNGDVKVDCDKIKKVLLLRLDDKIGDMVVASGVIRFFSEKTLKFISWLARFVPIY